MPIGCYKQMSAITEDTNRLHVDVARTSFASRAFRHVAPSVWNALPVHLNDVSQSLDSFKKQLKTFLYSQAYRHWQSSSSAPAIQFNHILICFHWHMARHQLRIIIIIIIMRLQGNCNYTKLQKKYNCVKHKFFINRIELFSNFSQMTYTIYGAPACFLSQGPLGPSYATGYNWGSGSPVFTVL